MAELTPTPVPPPNLRYLGEKRYMLTLINVERSKAGLAPVVLGDNIAAQLHAESALENCFTGHWGIDGLKPYMRYSLAGGYQANAENGLGYKYCISAVDGFHPISAINQEIRKGMQGWMGSSGHRRNILDRFHKKVNIGLAWDKYRIAFYQHFEGDYVDYEQLPSIQGKTLSVAGTAKNGVELAGVQLYYDPPPGPLTKGQLGKTRCYDNGQQITSFRPPAGKGYRYTDSTYRISFARCLDPRDVPSDLPDPKPPQRFFHVEEVPPPPLPPTTVSVPWTTAWQWTTSEDGFSLRANIGRLLDRHGPGVYTVMVWGKLREGVKLVISQYSIFYGVTPPPKED